MYLLFVVVRSAMAWMLVTASVVVGGTLRLSAAEIAGQTTAPAGRYKIARITLLDSALGDLPLALTLRDRKVVAAWVMIAPDDGKRRGTMFDGAGVTIVGDRLQGVVVDSPPYGASGVFLRAALEAAIADGRIAGQYALSTEVSGRRTESRGQLVGEIVSDERLGKDNAYAAGAAWPCFRGPNSNFTATNTGVQWVENLTLARPVWRSEEKLPGMPGRCGGLVRYLGGIYKEYVIGSGATPVVWDNKVYVKYFLPSGAPDQRALAHLKQTFGDEIPNLQNILVGADDIVICMDARTGKTLWKTVYRDTAFNTQEHKNGVNNLTAAVADGRVFAVGVTGRLFCLDAFTGKPLWDGNIGGKFEELERLRLEAKKLQRYVITGMGLMNRDWGIAPAVAGGVLVCPDMKDGMAGYDAATGRELWHHRNIAGMNTEAVVWKHQGRELVLAMQDNVATLIDPPTGKILWQQRPPAGFAYGVDSSAYAVTGDLMVLQQSFHIRAGSGLTVADSPTGVLNTFEGYRVTLEEATHLWSIAADGGFEYGQPPIVTNGAVFLGGRNVLAAFDAQTGKELAKLQAETIASAGHYFAGDGRVFVNRDGKHGLIEMKSISPDPKNLRLLDKTSWLPPQPHSTSYSQFCAYPLVDGRIFIRGHDGVYCYDLRAARRP